MSGVSKTIKRNLTTVFLVVVLLIGLSLILYPTVSDFINSLNQSKVISQYSETVAGISSEKYTEFLQQANEYNQQISKRDNVFELTEEEKNTYNGLLNISGNGIMGYVEIPTISCSLPIYHGTSNNVLQTAIGHLEWTSLPTGGEGTHCVISGHRGLPSAKLFTNLDKLVEGDLFMLRVLNEVYTYQVDQILIVEPDQVECLKIEKGEDYCTLFTCTPYGINTHRLCVRGKRVENVEQAKTVHVTAEAMQIDPLIVAPIVAMPILFVLFILVLFLPAKERR